MAACVLAAEEQEAKPVEGEAPTELDGKYYGYGGYGGYGGFRRPYGGYGGFGGYRRPYGGYGGFGRPYGLYGRDGEVAPEGAAANGEAASQKVKREAGDEPAAAAAPAEAEAVPEGADKPELDGKWGYGGYGYRPYGGYGGYGYRPYGYGGYGGYGYRPYGYYGR